VVAVSLVIHEIHKRWEKMSVDLIRQFPSFHCFYVIYEDFHPFLVGKLCCER
jgi:hypothetical protein